jgi:hypothetical protein
MPVPISAANTRANQNHRRSRTIPTVASQLCHVSLTRGDNATCDRRVVELSALTERRSVW